MAGPHDGALARPLAPSEPDALAAEPGRAPGRPERRPRGWTLHGVHRAERDIVAFLDRELPGTLNRLLDVSGPVCCRRTLEGYLPGLQAVRYALAYEFLGRASSKELLLAPLHADREALDDAVADDRGLYVWDAAFLHDGAAARFAFELDLARGAPEPVFRLAPDAPLPLNADLGRRLRAFFRNPLQDRPR